MWVEGLEVALGLELERSLELVWEVALAMLWV